MSTENQFEKQQPAVSDHSESSRKMFTENFETPKGGDKVAALNRLDGVPAHLDAIRSGNLDAARQDPESIKQLQAKVFKPVESV